MDIFVEQMIKRKQNGKDFLIYGALVLAALVIIVASLILFPPLLFLAVVGSGAGIYFGATSRSIEFEYSVTNGDFTVDKIINKSRRKRLINLDLHEVEQFGKYQAQSVKVASFQKQIAASVQENGADAWYLTVRHPKFGNTLVLFSPEEALLNAAKPFLKRQVVQDAFNRN